MNDMIPNSYLLGTGKNYLTATENLHQRHLMMEECLEWYWFEDEALDLMDDYGDVKVYITEDGLEELEATVDHAQERFEELQEKLKEDSL